MSMVFALVLLGCADDGSACERLAVAAESHASKARCEARRESALSSEAARKADYPTVMSRCERRAPPAARRSARRLDPHF